MFLLALACPPGVLGKGDVLDASHSDVPPVDVKAAGMPSQPDSREARSTSWSYWVMIRAGEMLSGKSRFGYAVTSRRAKVTEAAAIATTM
jgi:hypothetical protein